MAKIAITCPQRVKGDCVVRPPMGSPIYSSSDWKGVLWFKRTQAKREFRKYSVFFTEAALSKAKTKFSICQTPWNKVSVSPQSTWKRADLSAHPAVEMRNIPRQKQRNCCGLLPCTSGAATVAKVTHQHDLQTRNSWNAGQEDQT